MNTTFERKKYALKDFKAWYIQPKGDNTSLENEFLLLERETDSKRVIFQIQEDKKWCEHHGCIISGELESGTCDIIRTFETPNGGGYRIAIASTVYSANAPKTSDLHKLYNMYSEKANTETEIEATKQEIESVCNAWRKPRPRKAWFDDHSDYRYERKLVAIGVQLCEFY